MPSDSTSSSSLIKRGDQVSPMLDSRLGWHTGFDGGARRFEPRERVVDLRQIGALACLVVAGSIEVLCHHCLHRMSRVTD